MNDSYFLFGKTHWLGIVLAILLLAACWIGQAKDSNIANLLTFLDIGEGKLFTQTGEGRLSAIDADTGSMLWSFHDPGLRFFTKAVFDSGSLFVAATSSRTSSELIRLDAATGGTKWRESFEGLGGNASPVLCGADVLVGDFWHRTVSAFNVATGKNDWKTESQPFLFLFPPAILDGDALFFAANKEEPESKQQLVTLSCADGLLSRSSLSVHIDGVSRTPVLLYQDTVVISGHERTRGTSLKRIRKTDGAQLWSALIPDEITRFTPSIQGKFLVAGALSLWVLDLDTGRVLFNEARPTGSVPIAVRNGLIFSSGEKQTIEARELPSGKLRWSRKLRGRISSNIVATDTRVFVRVGDDQLATLTMAGEIDKYFQIRGPGI